MNLPTLYLVDTGVTTEQQLYIMNALSIHPVAGVVLTSYDVADIKLAYSISKDLIFDDLTEADLITKYTAIAKHLGAPIALVGHFPDHFKCIGADANEEVFEC